MPKERKPVAASFFLCFCDVFLRKINQGSAQAARVMYNMVYQRASGLLVFIDRMG